jgi:hypothetical protein
MRASEPSEYARRGPSAELPTTPPMAAVRSGAFGAIATRILDRGVPHCARAVAARASRAEGVARKRAKRGGESESPGGRYLLSFWRRDESDG